MKIKHEQGVQLFSIVCTEDEHQEVFNWFLENWDNTGDWYNVEEMDMLDASDGRIVVFYMIYNDDLATLFKLTWK